MANNAFETQDNTVAAMLMQLNLQTAQQAMLQQELEMIKYKLDQASKSLAQKDQIIGSLELDLEHMIDQLVKIKSHQTDQQWIDRPVPGICVEAAVIA